MLIYTHNHAPGILLWQCSCHRKEKQNSESFSNYDANVTSVITMELKFIYFSLRCWFLCMMSLAVTSSMLKTSVKFWRTSFKFLLRPWKGTRYIRGRVYFSIIAFSCLSSTRVWLRFLLICFAREIKAFIGVP